MELDGPMRHPAQDKFQKHEKEAIHEREADPKRCSFRTQFVRHNQAKPFSNKADGASHEPSAQSNLCDPRQRMYAIHGQLACNPAFYSGYQTMKDLISYQYIPAETKFTFANGDS